MEAPSNRAGDPRAKIYIVDHLAPGSTIKREIEVSNTTAATRRIQLYAAGASVSGGQFTFSPGREADELSQWTKVTPGRLDLAPGTKGTASVTVGVPAQASAGERYAVVWAEVSAPAAAGQVTVVNRVGIRMYLSVGSGGEPASSFVISSLTARRRKDGRPVIEAKVTNTGGRAVELTGHLDLINGPGGLSAGPFAVEAGTTVAPRQSANVEMVLDPSMPLGPWDAKLVLRSGTVEAPASARISFPAHADSTGETVAARSTSGTRATSSSGRRPQIAVPAALLILVVLALLLVWKRRRDDEEGDAGTGRNGAPAGVGVR
jgi:hypothetical protein